MVKELEFITALKGNGFIRSIIVNNGFSRVNLSQFDYKEEWDDHYKFMNFQIGRWIFDSVNIYFQTGDLSMIFRTTDPGFAG